MLVLPQQCKASTEQSQRGFELSTVLLWGNSNNQTTTVPPINVVPSALILVCHWSEDIYTQRCWNFKYSKYQFLWVFSLFKKKISYQKKNQNNNVLHFWKQLCTVQWIKSYLMLSQEVSLFLMLRWHHGHLVRSNVQVCQDRVVFREMENEWESCSWKERGEKLFYLLKKHYSSEMWDKTYYSNHCVPNITTHAAIFWALKVGLTSSQPSF